MLRGQRRTWEVWVPGSQSKERLGVYPTANSYFKSCYPKCHPHPHPPSELACFLCAWEQPGCSQTVLFHPARCHGSLPSPPPWLAVVWAPHWVFCRVLRLPWGRGWGTATFSSFGESQMHFTVLWSICPHVGRAIVIGTQSWSERTLQPGPSSGSKRETDDLT